LGHEQILRDFRFGPESGHYSDIAPGPLSAKSDQSASQQIYSITLSARSKIDCGNTVPIVFAVRWLMASSNSVGCSIGKPPELPPVGFLLHRGRGDN
jgi:hypothetical protein